MMPSPTLWDMYGSWAIYAIVLALLALLGPAILDRSGARAFVVCVVLVWLAAAIVKYPVPFSAAFWVSQPAEASAGFAATGIGYGLPIWGAAIWIWTFRASKQSRARRLLQGLGGLAIGALLSPLSETVALIVAIFLIEGIVGIR